MLLHSNNSQQILRNNWVDGVVLNHCHAVVGRANEDITSFASSCSVAVLEYKRIHFQGFLVFADTTAAFNTFVSVLQRILHWIGQGTHCTGQMPFMPGLKCWILIPWSELSCFALVLTASQEPLVLTLEQGDKSIINSHLVQLFSYISNLHTLQLLYFISWPFPISHFISTSLLAVPLEPPPLSNSKGFHSLSQLALTLSPLAVYTCKDHSAWLCQSLSTVLVIIHLAVVQHIEMSRPSTITDSCTGPTGATLPRLSEPPWMAKTGLFFTTLS